MTHGEDATRMTAHSIEEAAAAPEAAPELAVEAAPELAVEAAPEPAVEAAPEASAAPEPIGPEAESTSAYPLDRAIGAAIESAEPGAAQGIAGEVAVDLARQLAEPVRALRDRLGLVVDHLERHVATSTGPTSYPWRSLQALRQDLAGAYLEATSLARRLDELDRALEVDPPGWFDLAASVDLGLHLAGHHLATGIELLIDLGNTPPVRGSPGTVALIVAQLVGLSALSARALPGSSVSVRVVSEGGAALLAIADNGAGSARVAGLGELIRQIMAPWGATIDAASLPGAGCAFELRLSTTAEPGD
jgi:signal transduction histidine kinase